MKCSFCSQESYIHLPYLKKDLCRRHFERMVKKRFRSNIKRLGMLEKGDEISYRASSRPEDVFLGMMLEGMPYRKTRKGKRVSPDFLDRLSWEFLESVFSGEWKWIDLDKETKRPCFNFPFREIKAYLEMNGKEFSGGFQTHPFLEKAMETRPGAMFSLSRWWHDRGI